MSKKLPAKIFVRWEKPSNDEPYMVASTEMYGLVEGPKVKVGTYVLVETVDAELIVSAGKPVKAKR